MAVISNIVFPPPQVPAGRRAECSKCHTILQNMSISGRSLLLEHSLEDLFNERGDFLKVMNGFINTDRGGVVIIHAENIRLLDDFNKKVKDDLKGLIPDGSEYVDNFEVKKNDDNHVLIRVKPRRDQVGLSTLNFNCKQSLDSGFENPTQSQMQRLVKTFSETAPQYERNDTRPDFTLCKGEEAKVNGTVFQESARFQAKDVQRKNVKAQGSRFEFEEADFPYDKFWDKYKVRECISGMARVDDGGYIFIGLFEKETPVRLQPNNTRAFANPLLCFGFKAMDDSKRRELGDKIRNNVCNRMLWLGLAEPEQPIKLVFHRPKNARDDERVVEIRVEQYHGICFYHNDGPEAYRMPRDPEATTPVRFTVNEWVKGNGGSDQLKKQDMSKDTLKMEVIDTDHNENENLELQ
ncbi:hypothetical protein BaRGS_00040503 [Batillaria attramentaria]|uniref:Schlafen AlbA-2 domain-containing protein n=1 Tax=Batillaria attramentaria TaxID=370345 RepID=A0ABD0IZT9_9CAEN